jgi:hypothetical protein
VQIQQEENFRLKRELAQVTLLLKAQETISLMEVGSGVEQEQSRLLRSSIESTSTEVENFSDSNSSGQRDSPLEDNEAWTLSTSAANGIAFDRAKSRYGLEYDDDYDSFTDGSDEKPLKDTRRDFTEDRDPQSAESQFESDKPSHVIDSSSFNKDLKVSDPYNIIHLEDDLSEMNHDDDDDDDDELSDNDAEEENLEEEGYNDENEEDSLDDYNDTNEMEDEEEYERNQEKEQSESYDYEENDQEDEAVNTSLDTDFFRKYYDEKLLNELV